jgi:hypothetical protein
LGDLSITDSLSNLIEKNISSSNGKYVPKSHKRQHEKPIEKQETVKDLQSSKNTPKKLKIEITSWNDSSKQNELVKEEYFAVYNSNIED